jgi:Na+-driven multidrug efflux pump
LVLMIFPRQLLGFFSKDIGFVNLGIAPIRIIIVTFPLLGFQFVSGTLFQAIGKPLPATIITLARQILFLIPAILIFPIFWGLTGIWMTWPFSDVMDFIVCSAFIVWEIRIINRMLDNQLKIKQESI